MSYTNISALSADRVGDKNVAPLMDGHEVEDSLSAVRGMLIACLLGAMGWAALLAPFIG